jgi:hypothetical protein
MKKCCVVFMAISFILSLPFCALAQEEKDDETYTAYEYMSKYYKEDFNPFKKKNIYLGLSFSLDDRREENTTGLFQNVIDGQRNTFNFKLKGGYYISDYTLVGVNVFYEQDKFVGDVFRDPDSLQSNSISRRFDITPNIRPSIPLTKDERLSFFIELGLTFGYLSELRRETKNIDEVTTRFIEGFHFRAGVSPGVTFFAIESFAFEVQLNLLGYDLQVNQQTENGGNKSRTIDQSLDGNVNILTLQLGLAYYFGSKK